MNQRAKLWSVGLVVVIALWWLCSSPSVEEGPVVVAQLKLDQGQCPVNYIRIKRMLGHLPLSRPQPRDAIDAIKKNFEHHTVKIDPIPALSMRAPDGVVQYILRAEPDVLSKAAAVFAKLRPTDGLILDVGANGGTYGLMAQSVGLPVIAFDPQVDCLMSARVSALLTGIEHPTQFRAAVSGDRTHGEVLYIPDNNACDGGLMTDVGAKTIEDPYNRQLVGLKGAFAAQFPATRWLSISKTMSAFCDGATSDRCQWCLGEGDWSFAARELHRSFNVPRVGQYPRVSWMKCDTEGYEGDVIMAAAKMFTARAIERLQIELSPVFWRRSFNETTHPRHIQLRRGLKILADAGYVACCLGLCPEVPAELRGPIGTTSWSTANPDRYWDWFHLAGHQSDYFFAPNKAVYDATCTAAA